MFKHVLVPTDFSKKSKQALDIAINIALHYHGDVNVVHVVEVIAGTTYEEFNEFYKKLEKQAQKKMNNLLGPYQDSEVMIKWHIMYGKRTQEILKFAAENKTDLIVMNSHKIDLQDPSQGWGSISYKVGILSQCPVMLVK